MKFRREISQKVVVNDSSEETIVQVLQSNARANNKQIEKGFMIALESCVHTCIITTPYFLPSKKVRNSLRKAAERGIEIEIITAGRTGKNNFFFFILHLFFLFIYFFMTQMF